MHLVLSYLIFCCFYVPLYNFESAAEMYHISHGNVLKMFHFRNSNMQSFCISEILSNWRSVDFDNFCSRKFINRMVIVIVLRNFIGTRASLKVYVDVSAFRGWV